MRPGQMAETIHHHTSHWGTFTAQVENGQLVGVKAFDKDPDPSPIIHSMIDAVYDESRVDRPFIRKGWLEKGPGGDKHTRGYDPYIAVPWDEALDIVANELERVRSNFGNQAIFGGSYGWSSAGRFHHAKTQLQRFLCTIGGFTNQVHTYSIAAGYAILPHVLGTPQSAMIEATTWDSIVENSELVVAFGGIPLKNTQVTSGGPGQHVAGPYLKAAKSAGVEFVNISPIRDDMGEFLDAEWIDLRPNTDVAFMLALAYIFESEQLLNRDFLDNYCVGYSVFSKYLLGKTDNQPKTPEWASTICGISPERIRSLAIKMASKRTIINTNWALQRGDHGEQPFWMTVVLAAMLGQIGLPGGGFGFGYGSMGNIGNPREPIASPELPIGENPCPSWIPVARISDMLLNPGEKYDFNGEKRVYPDIKLIYWCGGNPFHHHQDLNRLVEAWRKPETIIVNEPWWTATAKFSDIVLPSTTTLERNDIGATSRDRFILAMQKSIEPLGDSKNDYDIFSGISKRLGSESEFTEGRNEQEWLRHIYDRARQRAAEKDITLPSFDTFWSEGHVETLKPKKPHVMFSDYLESPDIFKLPTPSGKIEIFSETIEKFGYDDCPGHPVWLEPEEWLGCNVADNYPLHLISNQPRTRLHGQMDNGKISRESKIQDREPIWINPLDAESRSISDGDVVRVYNKRGQILAGVLVTTEVKEGVLQLSTGAWYDPADPSSINSIDKHGNPNVLTIDKGTSRLGQGPIAHSALVEVEKYDIPPPPVTAFKPPRIIAK